MKRLKGLYILESQSFPLIYGAEEQRDILRHIDFVAPPQTRESIKADPSPLAEAEVIFSGWGAPMMNTEFMSAAPHLRAVFYGAGTTGYFTSEAFWDRDITLTSAYAANAVPVAEYTLGTILLGLRNFWSYSAHAKAGGEWRDQLGPMPGGYGSTVALIGCGMIARHVIRLLKSFDLNCIVYDPYLDDYEAAHLGVTRCSLDEAFRLGDIVSLHAADKLETKGMITREHFSAMKPRATFINTARGPIIRETDLTDVLRQRPDLTAVIDVCDIEPPLPGSALLSTPNLILTPHIAGSHDKEISRLGRYMVEELERYVNGKPLHWQITRALSAQLA
jgi:phosphoglycerate dehydrogenase-like enzyme